MERREIAKKGKRASGRGRFRHRVLLATIVSLFVNLALVVKILVFDPNYPFRPICYRHQAGLVVLTEPMNEKFIQTLHSRSTNGRVSRDGIFYIPYWDWRGSDNREILWNWNRSVAVEIHEERIGRRMTPKEYEASNPQYCRFIGRYALD